MNGGTSAGIRDATANALADARQHHLAGRLAEAEARYRSLLALAPKSSTALEPLGVLLCQTGRFAEACEVLERVSAAEPDNVGVLVNLSVAYRAAGRAKDAAAAVRDALALQPDLAAAHFNLGHALRDLGDLAGAAAAYRRYLELCPNDAEGYSILGDTYLMDDLTHEAIAAFEFALTFDPAHFNAHLNIAHVLRGKGWFHGALAIVEALARARPTDPEAQRTHGAGLLQLGQFSAGWPKFEQRFETPRERVIRRPEPPPYWRGQDLSGKRLLVWTEQGLGDEILYGSMVPDLLSQARHCVIECSARMAPVFRRSYPQADVVAYEHGNIAVSRAENFDYQVAIASLGQYLRPDFASFPNHAGYLKSDADKAKRLRAAYLKLASGRKIVGLSWRSTSEIAGPHKSGALCNLAELLRTPGVMFVNLQYGDCAAEIAAAREEFGVEIFQDPAVDPIADVDAFFAQVSAMDLVITTSNTTAHVAGSQNVPVWVLLPRANGLFWYWFVGRDDSPWYPSARLIRAITERVKRPWELEPAARAAADLARLTQA
jgi:Flp pilus assembly protein TadD